MIFFFFFFGYENFANILSLVRFLNLTFVVIVILSLPSFSPLIIPSKIAFNYLKLLFLIINKFILSKIINK